MFKLKLDIMKKDKDDLQLIYRSISPDLMSGERSHIFFDFSDKGLNLEVESTDSVSLRASLNTVLRQVKLVEDTIDVLGGYDGRKQQ